MKKQIKQQNNQYICQEKPKQDYLLQTTTWLSGGLEILNDKGSGKPIQANYATSNNALKSGKVLIKFLAMWG